MRKTTKSLKYICAIICAVIVPLSIPVPAYASEWKDVSNVVIVETGEENASDDEILRWSIDAAIVPADDSNTIDEKCTGSEFASYLWRINGSPSMGAAFNDSESDSAVQWAMANGMSGFGDAGTADSGRTSSELLRWLWEISGCPDSNPNGLYHFGGAVNEWELWAADAHILMKDEQPSYDGNMRCSDMDALRYIYYLYHYRQSFAITREELVQAADRVMQEARAGGYTYGDSHGLPPTSDGIISCDRLICKALWDLGYTDQSPGGGNKSYGDNWYRGYLDEHGFVRSYDMADIGYGSIVEVRNSKGEFHTFLSVSYDPSTGSLVRYDAGSQSSIDSVQPLDGGFYWPTFVCVWNIPE